MGGDCGCCYWGWCHLCCCEGGLHFVGFAAVDPLIVAAVCYGHAVFVQAGREVVGTVRSRVLNLRYAGCPCEAEERRHK